MNTFLPYPVYGDCAKVLDRQRLGKQRVEVLQILKALTAQSGGWRNHPAVLMWRGCRNALVKYGVAICDEWIRRGYKDSCREKILAFDAPTETKIHPSWMGSEAFHAAMRSNLLRKDPTWYGQFGWSEPPDLPYVWPLP